jgi:hypothetical protein
MRNIGKYAENVMNVMRENAHIDLKFLLWLTIIGTILGRTRNFEISGPEQGEGQKSEFSGFSIGRSLKKI